MLHGHPYSASDFFLFKDLEDQEPILISFYAMGIFQLT